MILRRFSPGVTSRRSAFLRGNAAEPGHRMLVRAYVAEYEHWCDARYNRATRRFWLRIGPSQYTELEEGAVTFWTQYPPRGPEATPDPEIPARFRAEPAPSEPDDIFQEVA